MSKIYEYFWISFWVLFNYISNLFITKYLIKAVQHSSCFKTESRIKIIKINSVIDIIKFFGVDKKLQLLLDLYSLYA
jgi:hypothetical protein